MTKEECIVGIKSVATRQDENVTEHVYLIAMEYLKDKGISVSIGLTDDRIVINYLHDLGDIDIVLAIRETLSNVGWHQHTNADGRR